MDNLKKENQYLKRDIEDLKKQLDSADHESQVLATTLNFFLFANTRPRLHPTETSSPKLLKPYSNPHPRYPPSNQKSIASLAK